MSGKTAILGLNGHLEVIALESKPFFGSGFFSTTMFILEGTCVVFADEGLCRLLGRENENLAGAEIKPLLDSISDPQQLLLVEDFLQGKTHRAVLELDCELRLPHSGDEVIPVRLWLHEIPGSGSRQILGCLINSPEAAMYEKALKRLTDQVDKLKSRISATQENHFDSVMRYLHDVLGQDIMILKYRLDKYSMEQRPLTNEELMELSGMVSKISEDNRRFISRLNPRVISKNGFKEALKSSLREFAESTDFMCDFRLVGSYYEPKPYISTNLYRIFQELVLNVCRHSGGSRVEIILSFHPEKIVMKVIDNGCGMPGNRSIANEGGRSGTGLINIHERLKTIEGEIRIETSENKGTTVIVTVPGGKNSDAKD